MLTREELIKQLHEGVKEYPSAGDSMRIAVLVEVLLDIRDLLTPKDND